MADYRIVREPGPHVMRVEVALTEAETSEVHLDTIWSILPTGYIFSGTKSLSTGQEPLWDPPALKSRLRMPNSASS